jgi:hypothetical protein
VGKIKEVIGISESALTRTLNVIDNGLADLNNQSNDWKNVLEGMQAQLTEDIQSTIRNEITQLIQRSTEAVSSNVKCIIDLVRSRVKEDLLDIRAELVTFASSALKPADLLNIPSPALKPFVCTIIPAVVDMALSPNERNHIEIYGFDFEKNSNMQVLLMDSTQTINVTQYLDYPTRYMMTLNLGGSGIPVSSTSQKLVLKWQGNEIHSIGIIQPTTPICITKYPEAFIPHVMSYMPPKVNSDTEFNGNGPEVWVTLNLENTGSSILAHLYMRAKETKSNWTEAAGIKTSEISLPFLEAGYRINSIISPTSDSLYYVDNNTDPDNFASTSAVNNFYVVGDTDHGDAGEATMVTVTFNPIKLSLIQTGNCVDPNKVVEGVGQNRIGQLTAKRLFPSISEKEWDRLPLDQRNGLNPDVYKLVPKGLKLQPLYPTPTP